jgi:hypothetical protein
MAVDDQFVDEVGEAVNESGAAVEEIVAGLVVGLHAGIDADVFEIRRAGKAGRGDVVVANGE